jgi:hypothetical protein
MIGEIMLVMTMKHIHSNNDTGDDDKAKHTHSNNDDMGTTRPNGMTMQQQGDARQWGETTKGMKQMKKRPKRRCLTSLGLLVSLFFFSFHVFVTNIFRYLLELLMTKVSWHPPPPLRATARQVGMGATPKWRDNGNTTTGVNAPWPVGGMGRWSRETKWDKDSGKTTTG